MTRRLKTVGFQFDEDDFSRLEKESAKYGNISPGQFARKIVKDHLDDVERNRIRNQLAEVHESLELLRSGVADGIELLLLKAGTPKEEAQELINEFIRKR